MRWIIIFFIATFLGCSSKTEIKQCEIFAELAMELERARMKGISRVLVAAALPDDETTSQEFTDRNLQLLDDIYNRNLGNSLDEIRSNAKKICLKNPL